LRSRFFLADRFRFGLAVQKSNGMLLSAPKRQAQPKLGLSCLEASMALIRCKDYSSLASSDVIVPSKHDLLKQLPCQILTPARRQGCSAMPYQMRCKIGKYEKN
jgi:hypothetical protein